MDEQHATARQVMHAGCRCIPADATLLEASKVMADEGIGAMPICGEDDALIGMLTDRDIVVKGLAADRDPATCTAGELASGRLIWVYDDIPAADVLAEMERHQVRRIPVVDRDRQLVGIIAQADIARRFGDAAVGELVEVVSQAPPRQAAAF